MREIFARVPCLKSRADTLLDSADAAEGHALEPRPYPPGTVPALAHSLSIISYLNSRAPEPATLAEISTRLKISKSHCHAILRTLAHFDWVEFDPRLKTYTLQSGALSDISSLLASPMLESIRASLTKLVERVGVPCILSKALPDRSFVVIDTFRSRHFMQIFYPVGHRFPENACAQMRAQYAWQPAEAIDERMRHWTGVRYTERTLVDRDAVRAEIAAARARGYARSFCEFSEGMLALALPIFDRNGKVAYVFSCSYLAADKSFDEPFIAAEMRKAMSEIHRATLAQPPLDLR
jgi:DNA-binding IclR family transcriptional regulator